MPTRTPTRLELNRLKHRWTGGSSRPLPVSELSLEERAILSEAVLEKMLARFWDYTTARTIVFNEWNVV